MLTFCTTFSCRLGCGFLSPAQNSEGRQPRWPSDGATCLECAGHLFGMTGTAEPSFSVVPSGLGGAGELRMYQPFIVAEGFSTLARYIGVFGDPQNEGKQPMAMTAPVSTAAESPSRTSSAPAQSEEA